MRSRIKAKFSGNSKEQRDRDVRSSNQPFEWDKMLPEEPGPSLIPSPAAPIGIKVWYDCQNPMVDICFIHGLCGNRETSWTADQTEPWPKVLLGPQLKTARILTYGYDAQVIRVRVASTNRLLDHAMDLLNDLSGERRLQHESTRPLIFVAHSLGGLVLKKALLLSCNNSKDHLRQIFACTKGIAFMGTPHSGSFMAEWANIPASVFGLVKSTNTSLLQVLQTDNQYLESIQVEFLQLIRRLDDQRLDITCFFEQLPYSVVGCVVSKDSATFPGYNSVSIPANHRDMVRFSSVQDPGYTRLYHQLSRWESDVKDASQNAAFLGTGTSQVIRAPASTTTAPTPVLPTPSLAPTSSNYGVPAAYSHSLPTLSRGPDYPAPMPIALSGLTSYPTPPTPSAMDTTQSPYFPPIGTQSAPPSTSTPPTWRSPEPIAPGLNITPIQQSDQTGPTASSTESTWSPLALNSPEPSTPRSNPPGPSIPVIANPPPVQTVQQSSQGDFHNVYGGQVVHFHGVQNFANSFSALSLSNGGQTPVLSAEEEAKKKALSSVCCRFCEKCKAGKCYVKDLQRLTKAS
jgi:protein SERAC1